MADYPHERMRALKSRGLSEEEAAIESAKASPSKKTYARKDEDRIFVVVTKDFSGLGWAKKLTDEGEDVYIAVDYDSEDDPKLRTQMKLVGDGWFDVYSLDDAMKECAGENTYWVFAENCFPEFAAELEEAGQKIFPPSWQLSEKMEHDRQYAISIVEEAGLEAPVTHDFSSLDKGCAFLDKHPDTAYVFKPDNSEYNYMTFVPVRQDDADANRDVYTYLEHLKQDPGSFVLQERIPLKDALEVNVEVWVHEGEPILAFLGLEVKRKNTGDLGEMAGCGGDFMQIIPLDCPLVEETIGLLLPFYKEQQYTGFADVNVLIEHGNIHFLEVCNRFGYNAHVGVFLGLAKDTFGNLIADFVEGNVDDFPSRFAPNVAGTLTVFLDHPREGLPITVTPSVDARFYPMDGMREDDAIMTTGYSTEIGILVQTGSSIQEVAKKLNTELKNEHVSVADGYWRTDTGASDYPNAPARRYAILKREGWLE